MIAYILKSSLSLILLFGLYWFLLRQEKLFIFNRFFLIFSLLFSLVIPFVSISVNIHNTEVQKTIVTALNNNIAVFNQNQNPVSNITFQPNTDRVPSSEKLSSSISYLKILSILYAIGVILLLIRFLRNIFFISHQKRLSEKITYSGQKLVLIDHQINPFCFFNAIFVSKQDYLNNNIAKELLTHELEHIYQSHSIDVIFIELIQIIYWFNPVLILYNKAIRVNHEYLADRGVIKASSDIKSYAHNLINFISCKRNIPLTSGFNPSLTRKRLIMLTKAGSSKINYGLRIFFTSILVGLFFLILSCFPSNSQSVTVDKKSDGFNMKQTQVIKDIDGNEYKTVKIGTQTWMSENLKTTKYNDGTDIPLVTEAKGWQEFTPAYCWYNNEETADKNGYGALYNWYAVNTNKLCPTGWHVPTSEDTFLSFFRYLNPKGFSYKDSWKDLFKSITDSGFKPIPAGSRNYSEGTFGGAEKNANWWISNEENSYIAKGWAMNFINIDAHPIAESKRNGNSVRCVKDFTKEEILALNTQKESILNSLTAADFSGKWELDMKKTPSFKKMAPSTLTISQKDNTVTFQGALDFPNRKPLDRSVKYSLEGKVKISKVGDKTHKVSAEWSLDNQSFTITTEIDTPYNGSILEMKRVESYSLSNNGRSLQVYLTETLPGSDVNPQWGIYNRQ
jgi:uncharacterized protein (TIGR02145 family)